MKKEFFDIYNDVKIPAIGFGTWQIDNSVAKDACLVALKEGYRHIDTAKAYGNEQAVGASIKESGLKREDIFITSKIPAEIKNYEDAKRCIKESLELLDTPYIDLMLIHAPKPWSEMGNRDGYRYFKENCEVYKALEEAYEEGLLKTIGVSNFEIVDIENIIKHNKIKPMVNQICIFAGATPIELIKYCQDNEILVEAYSPLATGKLFDKPLIIEMAKKYNVSVAKLAIRYCYQLGTLPLPKSVTPSRIKENLDIFDFVITDEDMIILKNTRF